MRYQLSDSMKETISRKVGIPYEKILKMDDEEIESYIEKKLGKKISWPEIGNIRTMDYVDKRIDQIIDDEGR